ncbi:type II toxin-antitoxin system PemK/MazF family toxin [Mycobacterium talmoniae]|uniref:Endoribonuclease MazF3 n=1 Tax=Mycobacterium talmoniae TaxID=1858794 RepID=A0A1S1MPW0_9MYCO|nr:MULTISPECIES: type II toxin-antitoxin system PemK/MazF family toxin [Mycobacterium]OHU90246.1 mRNA interferase MazF3 [Mycobacterium talmoniae]PQM47253.1 Endoribonuclease MazF3 [Mycobacterium talmoniae]TDH46226.1 type II toxin-antitoxin system PemK/MazF family toxin [Mycobacterium eburneum]
MRPIHLAHLDKTRPVVILTRELVRPHLARVTIAPITGMIRGLSTEVAVGTQNGLQQTSVISCDNITTVPTDAIGRHIGYLLPDQELLLSQAIRAAFDLEQP